MLFIALFTTPKNSSLYFRLNFLFKLKNLGKPCFINGIFHLILEFIKNDFNWVEFWGFSLIKDYFQVHIVINRDIQ